MREHEPPFGAVPFKYQTTNEREIMIQKQKIGASKGLGRICLWNRKMIEAGFPIGQRITIYDAGADLIIIKPDDGGKRKVSGVMNHGKQLPVIDLKQTKAVNIAKLGGIGDSVTVEFITGKIIIRRAK